jgi:hypothetical protein
MTGLVARYGRLALCRGQRLDGVSEDFNDGLQSGDLFPHFEAFLIDGEVGGTAARSIELPSLGPRVRFIHDSSPVQGCRHSVAAGIDGKTRAER